MDKKTTSFLTLGILIGILFSSALFSILERKERSEQTPKTILKLAHVLPPASPSHQGMEFMAKRVSELSGDQVEIQIFPSAQLGSESESVEQLQHGALDMVKTSAAILEGFIPEMAVFGTPYLFPDNESYWKVLNHELGQKLLLSGTSANVRGLCYYDGGARSFYTVTHPILSPKDLKNQKIRTVRSKTAMAMVEVMGGAPTAIPFGELYTGLQQGMIDGAENSPPSVYDSRHWEIAKYYSLDEHTRIPDLIIFSEQIWQSLSPQIQSWIQQAAQESVAYQRKLWADYETDCIQKIKEQGMTVYYPDKSAFKEAVIPMYEAKKGTLIGELIEKIQTIQESDPQ